MSALERLTTTLGCFALVAAATAQQQAPPSEFGELSLEQLMEVPVEVSSRRTQSLAGTAAAVFVLNEPEIRRSGMRTVPELLRLVPGLVVAQDVPGAYGFSSRLGEFDFAGMLVLIDGQRLYPTLLRREYWQAIDLPLEIVERIEVVRGPGGSRWGDKASQGVINIVTKKAERAQGLRVTGWAGTEERLAGSFRWGETIDESSSFYLFGKLAQRDGGAPETSGDRWDNDSVGARVDLRLDDGVELSIDGLYHDSFLGDSFVFAPGFSSLNMIKGGHLKSRLRIDHDDTQFTEWRLGVDGYDQDIRDFQDNVPDEFLRFREEFVDTLVMHSWEASERHRFTVGGVLRSTTVERFAVFAAEGEEFNETRGDVFASWEWRVTDELTATLGGNVGYQDGRNGNGLDSQPDLRLAWQPSSTTTVWTAFSANREPDETFEDSGVRLRRRASRLLAFELGLRQRFGESLLLQVDTFAYEIDHQVSAFDTDPISGATLFRTDGRTDAFGGEVHVAWNPRDDVRVTGFVATTLANTRNVDQTQLFTIEEQVPRVRGGMTVGFDPLPDVELDANLLYTRSWAGIPTWWRLDLRLGWRATERTTLELVGQNLTDPQHPEYFFDEEIERGFYALVTHRF